MLLIDLESLPMEVSKRTQDRQEGGEGEEEEKKRKKMKNVMKYLTI